MLIKYSSFYFVVGGHKVAKISYIAIYSPVFTMAKPYIPRVKERSEGGGPYMIPLSSLGSLKDPSFGTFKGRSAAAAEDVLNL